jgi:hypothetical protein
MPRTLIIAALATLLLAAGPAAAVGIDLGIAAGFQFKGDLTDLDLDMDSGYSLGLELMFEIPMVDVGAGYEYGFPRDTDGILSSIEYHFFYGIARFRFLGPVYAMGRVGYANVRAELPDIQGSDNGLSWSLGLGVTLHRFKVEVDYNQFDIASHDLSGSLDNTNVAARLIVVF